MKLRDLLKVREQIGREEEDWKAELRLEEEVQQAAEKQQFAGESPTAAEVGSKRDSKESGQELDEEEDGEDLFCKALGVPRSRSPSGCVAAQEVP